MSQMFPQLVYGVADQRLNFLGYLVVDSTIAGKSSGGVRISTGVTLDEIAALAKNMTLKCGFLGIPRGGAKAGICVRGSLSKTEKRSIIAEFGKSIGRFVKSRYYFPGTDIGTTDEDVDNLLNAALGENERRQHAPSHVYTSWTMLISTEAVLNSLGSVLEGSAVVIEGFGKVGSAAARVFSRNGARIVGVSTVKGAIYDPQGLDVERLFRMRIESGDDFVDLYGKAKKVTKEKLVRMPHDILLPCAGSSAINSTDACEVRFKIVCPGANLPVTEKSEEILSKRNIVVVPDFVSNSGGLFGAFCGSMVSERQKWGLIESGFSKKVSEVIQLSKCKNVSLRKIATKVAMTRFYKTKAKAEGKNLKNQILKVIRYTVPKAYRKRFEKVIAAKSLASMLHQA